MYFGLHLKSLSVYATKFNTFRFCVHLLAPFYPIIEHVFYVNKINRPIIDRKSRKMLFRNVLEYFRLLLLSQNSDLEFAI